MAEKYPFGTAHLVLFGLCPEIADRADGIAKALLCHADSCFWVCGKYRKNARRWAERMFPNHPLVESLMSGDYESSHADAHETFVNTIRPLVYRGKEQACATEQWQRCTGHQTVRANNPFVLFKNVNALAKSFSSSPACSGRGSQGLVTHDPETAVTVWEGMSWASAKIRVEPSDVPIVLTFVNTIRPLVYRGKEQACATEQLHRAPDRPREQPLRPVQER